MVLAAVQQRGMALRYAAEAMLLGCSWDALGMLLELQLSFSLCEF